MTAPHVIPAEAVEAACIAQYKHEQGRDTWVPYDEMPGDFIARYEQQARLILEAAAPHMLAAAWEEGRDVEFQRSIMKRQVDANPYRPTP